MQRKGFALSALALLLAAGPAAAGNGHNLHGVGAVNSAMGGAGVALPNDALGALLLNPALLPHIDGNRFEFSAEYNAGKNAVESQVGPFSGRTEEDGDTSLIPAFGFTQHKPGARSAMGVGFLGLAGFGVDYPQDPTNPILAPQPQGFGRVYSNYQLLKVPNAIAFKINDSLSVGASLNVARGTLTADPAGFATPDCSGPAGPCFFPRVNADSAWGFGLGVGVYYKINTAWALGLSYQTETDFEDYEWNSAVANPNLPTFGTARTIKLQLNAPPVLVAGVGFTPNPKLSIAADAKVIFYEDTEGFKDRLMFENINVYDLGIQYKPTERLALRLGYNISESAVPEEFTFINVSVPAIFEDRITGGFGLQVTDTLTLNAAYYHVFENRISGPFLGPTGPVPGTRVTTEMAMDSVVLTFSFNVP